MNESILTIRRGDKVLLDGSTEYVVGDNPFWCGEEVVSDDDPSKWKVKLGGLTHPVCMSRVSWPRDGAPLGTCIEPSLVNAIKFKDAAEQNAKVVAFYGTVYIGFEGERNVVLNHDMARGLIVRLRRWLDTGKL